uniref:Uncharacterized protein n=1 Tax=Kalanchoe fedtschenkoi TaxID=63787 RepID=A0A7N1A0H4_KALFE
MESKHTIIIPTVMTLALFSFILCVVADFQRFKEKGVTTYGRPCHFQGSHSNYGIGAAAALTCLAAVQIIGNLLVFTFCTGCNDLCCFLSSRCDDDEEMEDGMKSIFRRKPTIAAALMLFSWLSFGAALLLASVATRNKETQAYGEVLLNRECYRVKDGLSMGAAVLLIFSVCSTVGSAILLMRHKQEQSKKAVSKSQEILSHI